MSRYPNQRAPYAYSQRFQRPLGYTLGDVTSDPSNPSILFGDPTLGGQTVVEQAAGVNQTFDPGMSFGVAPPGQINPLGAPDLSSVGLGAALQNPGVVIPGVSSGMPSAGLPSAGLPSAGLPSAGLPSAGWIRPALAFALIVFIVYGMNQSK